MAERGEQRPDEDTPPDGIPVPGAGASGEPSSGAGGSAAGPPLDPEQLRQFQQFQQFQEFLRFTEAQQGGTGQQGGAMVPAPQQSPVPHQPGPPQQPPIEARQYPLEHPGARARAAGELVPAERRPRTPRWLRKLGGKVLTAAIFLALLVGAGAWAYNHYFGSPDEDKTTEEFVADGGGTYRTNELLSKNPYEAVRTVYDAVAQNLVPQGCGRFAEAQQQDFARNMGFADCKLAVEALHGQVSNVNDYAESIPSYTSEPIQGDTITIDSCRFPISGGPVLGEFTATKVENEQWLITGHRPGPRECPVPPSTAPGN
ncbi:hypothetical protein CFN78_01080 [Amycolatopsis antarctica]|uniref:Uncharacterized protein n=1 Tax=Amycolatopsis antarctica TaxID=1854586 RepID=A0A263D8M6_9PSEU|nr:hypothetical protein [Amycolatopsis antarctica]OZM74840.1 hypothetical protein CFN78_01080 [Amycolatopsis antarctica]